MDLNSDRKIFGLGLSRTGTKSLTDALGILGFNVAHYPNDRTTLQELKSNNCSFSILQHVDGITDITVAPFYPELDTLFPGSKFILTIRDRASWLTALEKHWNFASQLPASAAESSNWAVNLEITRLLKMAVFGSYEFDRNHMGDIYNLYTQGVIRYFLSRPQDLLVIDICGGDGWEKLCPFLGCAVVEQPFPYIQTEQQLSKRSQHHFTLV
jgi:hypothetical protein